MVLTSFGVSGVHIPNRDCNCKWGFLEGVASTLCFLFALSLIITIGEIIWEKIRAANQNQQGGNQQADQAGGNQADGAAAV